MAEEHQKKARAKTPPREPSTRVDLELTLGRVREAIRLRNMQLTTAEYILIQRIARQHITLLNPVTRKLHVEFMELMSATLQLDCKMIRRNLFILRSRERHLMLELEVMTSADSAGAAGEQGDAA